MASYHVGEANVGFRIASQSNGSRSGIRPRILRSLSTFSFISEHFDRPKLSYGSYGYGKESLADKSKKHKSKRPRSGCRHCFLLRCFEFLGSPNAPESVYDADGDEVEYGPVRSTPNSLTSLIHSTNFTKKELKTLYRVFKNECPMGVVYEDTFKNIYSQFFPAGDANMYAHYVFKALDDTQDGYICFEDLVTTLSSLLRGSVEDKLQWTFRLYDINHDGFITRDEMQDVAKSIYSLLGDTVNSECCYIEHANQAFLKLDQNGDGYVTYSEFVGACRDDESVIASMKIFDFAI